MTLEFYQNYWWFLITVLGAILVFMLFVQGGQTLLYGNKTKICRKLMVNSLGRKWELTYTTLVLFGGAFFASFPLFYSTSFGGAYWLWMSILLSFVLQAVSYEFRMRKGNVYGTGTYDAFLFFNGLVGCVLLGVAVGTLFFGGDFTVVKTRILGTESSPIISQWGAEHGFAEILNWKNLLLGVTVFFLARTQAALYFINNIKDEKAFGSNMRTNVLYNGTLFVLLFLGFIAVLLCSQGVYVDGEGHAAAVANLYWHNLWSCWLWPTLLIIGVACVLYGIIRSSFSSYWTKGIWFSGIGTFLTVLTLLSLIGYNGTSYLPSNADIQSSLTLANSSSSFFTLKVMSIVSLGIPFVLAYIVIVWYKMNKRPITESSLQKDGHQY